MLVVVDASVLVQALTKFDDEGAEIRSWLLQLAAGERVEVLRNFTNLEFLNALRRLESSGALSEDLAHDTVKAFIELPATRRDVTQPMAVRIWELRHNITAYDAAYVALVERLQGEQHREDVALATLDSRLANSPNLSVPVELFSH